MSVPAKSINLTDFDFTVNRVRIMNASASHDGSVTIRMPGKARKSANHELVFVPYFKKHKVKFKTVAIGKNKRKAQFPVVIFDHRDLGPQSANIRKYEKIGGIVNSKGHALKILDIFKIAIPARADEVLKVYFRLQPTLVSRNKLNYRICVLTLMEVIKNDSIQKKRLPIPNKKRLKFRKSSSSREKGKKDKIEPQNIL